jgi:hypothetical protein
MQMTDQPSDLWEHGEEHDSNSPGLMPEMAYEEYYLDDGENPGGLKVKFKIRVVSGPLARDFDARQAEAIRELLRWAQRQQPAPPAEPGP